MIEHEAIGEREREREREREKEKEKERGRSPRSIADHIFFISTKVVAELEPFFSIFFFSLSTTISDKYVKKAKL